MPVVLPKNLPATEILTNENIFVMHEERAKSQDIRPLNIAIVNLMPTKIQTETQLLRLIGNTPLQVNVDFIHMSTHESKNSSKSHLETFYKDFEEIKLKKYDGMVITGAPVETLNFEEVDYWNELQKILDFAKTNVYSTMFICWGAQAGLYYYYNLNKISLSSKVFGVFEHRVLKRNPIVRGFDDVFFAPHSRHTTWNIDELEKISEVEVVAYSNEAGAYIVNSKDQRFIFISGHPEYDPDVLQQEYKRDLSLNLNINIPINYYQNNEPNTSPVVKWRGHANLLFANWLNYHVYQETPFEFF
ncbi:homoserine O-succinyltransferase [Candidatus Epulonipiscium fishelsonii]|uniref:Homoserine O-succinyltransferase n=1 Tax=Candidatus Epulonipiscium fishelsonii TaxID=77094 RepID=A0ACC8X9J3_9FIRM|nr:homoserine O-succinyltransferase [Epulopiscium sp. SCG-B11WGA-EpuloA1]ONI40911.1 homoserine O-succinyltransferase [Epulopiscium sp. SCG-B05WGA-EpuloA1]